MDTAKAKQFLGILAALTESNSLTWKLSVDNMSVVGKDVEVLCKWEYSGGSEFITVYQDMQKPSIWRASSQDTQTLGLAEDSHELRETLKNYCGIITSSKLPDYEVSHFIRQAYTTLLGE